MIFRKSHKDDSILLIIYETGFMINKIIFYLLNFKFNFKQNY